MAIAKKRKKFFDINIPLVGKETQAQAFEISELDGRIMRFDLTRTLKGKSTILQLDVKVSDGKAIAQPREIKVLPYFIKRMVRKGTNYVEDSFSTECKDAQLRIKPFLVTRRKVSRAIRKALRERAREELINYIKNKSTEELFKEALDNKIQKQLSLILKKIYPLSLCEIRVLKIEKN